MKAVAFIALLILASPLLRAALGLVAIVAAVVTAIGFIGWLFYRMLERL